MKKYCSILVLLLTHLLPWSADAQEVIQRTLGIRDGLVHNAIKCIFEDSRGYIWIGTGGGVSRWDGINWRNFQTQDGLPGSTVNAILETPAGELYIATSRGVAVLAGSRIVRTITARDGLQDSHVIAMTRRDDGTMLYGTWGGGLHFFHEDSLVQVLDEADGLANNIVMALAESQDGLLYIGTWGGGVDVWREGEIVRRLRRGNGLVNDHIWTIYGGRDGTIYFGTWGGLSVYRKGIFVDEVKHEEHDNFDVLSIAEYDTGEVYFGAGLGLWRYHANGSVVAATRDQGLPGNWAKSLMRSSQGVLLVGTNDGVALYRPGLSQTWTESHGLRGKAVSALLSGEDGTVYAGTGSGVNRFRDERWLPLLDKTSDLSSNSVTALADNAEGTLYVGTFGGGVNVVRDGTVVKHLDLTNGLRTNRVQSLLVGDDGMLYVGTWGGGMTMFRNHRFHRTLTAEHGLSGDVVHAIVEASDGVLYLSIHDFGISRLRDGTFLPDLNEDNGLANNSVTAIEELTDGRMLFATWGGGVSVFDGSDFQTLSRSDGLSSNIIYGVAEDDSGVVYLNTARGVNRLNLGRDPVGVRHITANDGLPTDSGTSGIMLGLEGLLWVGTNAGVTRLNPGLLATPQPPVTRISSVSIFGETIALPEGTLGRFAHDENFFTFEYVGIDIAQPERVRYRYRLAGVDPGWVESDGRNAQYTNLEPGNYIFSVMSARPTGEWGEAERVSFQIATPWWQTWWFRVFVLLAASLLVFLLYRNRVARHVAIERLRTRIASDLHDDIGVTLTHIALGAETIQASKDDTHIRQTAARIGCLSREVTQTFSDIIWSIDSRNDSMGELLVRMKELAFQLLTPAEISYAFEAEGLPVEAAIPVDVRQNVYLIFKECLNNILKHSGAGRVHIRIDNAEQRLRLQVSDNGRGLSSDPPRAGGRGFKNMQLRAQRLGGEVCWLNDDGVTVVLELRSI